MPSVVTHVIGLGFTAFASSVHAQSRPEWTQVIPDATVLSDAAPPSSFERRENNFSPVGVSSSLDSRPAALHTNKFYTDFLLDGPERSAWTLPYIITVNDEHPFGMFVSMPKFFEGQRAESSPDALKWYATASTKDIIISAQELNTNQEATLIDADDGGFSATVEFSSEDAPGGSMTTYLVRGMAYATVIYEDFTPEISSIHAILRVNGNSASGQNHTSPDGRFAVELNDGNTWVLYSSEVDLELSYIPAQPNEPNALRASMATTGTLRATRVPYEEEDPKYAQSIATLDNYASTYPVKGTLTAWKHATDASRATYEIEWTIVGDGNDLLHYALPHQQALLSPSVKTGIYLRSPTKGDMELVTGSTWTLDETSLPDFQWVPSMSAITNALERQWIEYYLAIEIAVPLDNVAGSSVYFGAKNLMAYAQLCLIAAEMERDDLVEFCMDQVEAGFEPYLQHTNGNPLVYDTIWGGVIGALGLEEGNEGADFYAAFYNDHHFHYSYVVNAAAVLAHLRPSWATDANKAWVETLIRDANDPNDRDAYFPHFRSFDWFSGHSWARGLLFAYDGKDQESTSEDVNFFYALTMWGIATGNAGLEGLGRLQTGVVTRSINEYFLLKDSNTNHPADFVKNKVTGIFFESKVDYTTWFGDNVEFIHGIQNIPVTAITGSVRDPQFVSEEWNQRLAPVVEEAVGVWETVLYMSYATVQKHVAFKEMLTSGVDDGLLRTWALYWAATRPECATYCDHDETEIEPVPVPTPAPVVLVGAFAGIRAVVPGLIEAEAYDYGGQGVGYFDTDAGNNGGAFRTDDVDISATAGGYAIGWGRAGEYLRYSVDVTSSAASYEFVVQVAAAPGLTGAFQIVSGGNCDDYTIDLTGIVPVASTGGWGNYEPIAWAGENTGGLEEGEQTIYFCIIEAGFNLDSFSMTAVEPELEGGPYEDTPAAIPGTIQAERFDDGGQDVAYYDTEANNKGRRFRTDEGVDISPGANGGFAVGWVRPGEYMRYTVDVQSDVEAFDFAFQVSARRSTGSLRVVSGGGCDDYSVDLSGRVSVDPTGGYRIFVSQSVSGGGTGGLSVGTHAIYVCALTAGFDLDSFTMTAVETEREGGAYDNTPAIIPGTVEGELYDSGGQGVAYSDTDAANVGQPFRTDEGVDLSAGAGGGYAVGWIRDDEFLRYTVEVQQNVAAFDFVFKVAAPGSSGMLQVVSGGGCEDYTIDLSGPVSVDATGGWSTYVSQSRSGGGTGGLSAGEHAIYVCILSAGFNLDSFTMTAVEPEIEGGPYENSPATIPGTIEGEQYDSGGQGVAYSDADAANVGQSFRPEEGVDISTIAGGGYAVGWLSTDEYLRYTVEVPSDVAAFDFEFQVSAPGSSGMLQVVSGGGCADYTVDLSGPVSIDPTGGWSTFVSQFRSGAGKGGLLAGRRNIFVCILSAGFDLDSFTMTATA